MNNNPNPDEFTEVYDISVYKKNDEDPTKWELLEHPFPEEIMTPEFTNRVKDTISDIFAQGVLLSNPGSVINYPTVIKNFWNVEVNDAIRSHLYKLKLIPNNDTYRFMIGIDEHYMDDAAVDDAILQGLRGDQAFPKEIVINPDSPLNLPEGFDILAHVRAQLQQAGGKRRVKRHTKKHTKGHMKKHTKGHTKRHTKRHTKGHTKKHTKKHTKATRKTRRN